MRKATLVSILFAITLVGCVDQAAQQRAQIAAQFEAARKDCADRFENPETRQNIVADVQCLNSAQAMTLPGWGTNKDLVQTFMAYRAMIAEQVQNGKMTLAEGKSAIATRWSQLESEMQHRNAVARSVAAQEQAANPSIACFKNGNMTFCN